jgi:superfamily II DNA or RNA helicase
MRIHLDTGSIKDYKTFLQIKALPKYSLCGSTAIVPDEYAALLGYATEAGVDTKYKPSKFLFDYQADIARTAITKRKYAVFADCGLGKTLIMAEVVKHGLKETGPKGRHLIVSPLMVVGQTIAEFNRFYGDKLPITKVSASGLNEWLATGTGVAITNYDAITEDLRCDTVLDGLYLDESSMLKSHYGAWGTRLIQLGKGVARKLCMTGTPAPNDRIEYANHAVFLDAFPTVNSFLARFFVNRGQTSERWALKAHALESFYVALSHWCIFLNNPATYGWKDNCGSVPPIKVHVDDVPLTQAQRDIFMEQHGSMFVNEAGGIGDRGKIARLGKGFHEGKRVDSNKTQYIVDLVASWPDESTIIWCKYNQEQDDVSKAIAGCGNIDGSTPLDERLRIIDDFKAGRIKVLVTKPKILGFGLNLQIATRHVFSGLQDSYEEFYQAVKRSNRYGSTKPLNVHIPTTDLERPMIETVLSKASRVAKDTEEQERIFHATNRNRA